MSDIPQQVLGQSQFVQGMGINSQFKEYDLKLSMKLRNGKTYVAPTTTARYSLGFMSYVIIASWTLTAMAITAIIFQP